MSSRLWLEPHLTCRSTCTDWAAEPGTSHTCNAYLNVPPITNGDVHRPAIVQLEIIHLVAALVGVHMACTAPD